MNIPDHWEMWTLLKYPKAQEGFRYAFKLPIRLKGHTVEIVGIGETPQQSIDEAERAAKHLLETNPSHPS